MSQEGGTQRPGFAVVLSFITGSVLLGFAAGCNQPPLSPTESAGKDLYEIHCYECHEENDLGLKKAPPKLHDVFAHKVLPDGTITRNRRRSSPGHCLRKTHDAGL
jgi:hypothetical protein